MLTLRMGGGNRNQYLFRPSPHKSFLLIFIYMIHSYFLTLFVTSIESNQIRVFVVLFASWRMFLTSPGMGMGGGPFGTI